jgi:hypothetical protein
MMPQSNKPVWFDLCSCAARAIIMGDLLPGGVLFEHDTVSAEDFLPWYKEKYPQQFRIVVLDQFKARLQSHRKQASEEYAVAQEQEEEHFAHDHKFYPRKAHNKRGNQSSTCLLSNHCCAMISRTRCIYTTRHKKRYNFRGCSTNRSSQRFSKIAFSKKSDCGNTRTTLRFVLLVLLFLSKMLKPDRNPHIIDHRSLVLEGMNQTPPVTY